MHDPALGRYWQIDPIHKYHESPYAWVTNNPIRFNDPLGLDTLDSSSKDFNWDNVKPGDVVDDVTVLDEVEVEGKSEKKKSSTGAERVAIAQRYLGNYEYGQKRTATYNEFIDDDNFCDCSEFFFKVLKESDPDLYKKLVWNSANGKPGGNVWWINEQLKKMGIQMRTMGPKVGDVIMWEGHVEFISWVDGESFTTIGASGSGPVPRILGKNAKGVQWLNTSYPKMDDMMTGDYLGFWTPPN